MGGMRSMHLDIAVDDAGVYSRTVLRRAGTFLAWLIGFVCVTGLIGILPTIFLFVIAYMRAKAKEPWGLTLPCAAGLTIFFYVAFDHLLPCPGRDRSSVSCSLDSRNLFHRLIRNGYRRRL